MLVWYVSVASFITASNNVPDTRRAASVACCLVCVMVSGYVAHVRFLNSVLSVESPSWCARSEFSSLQGWSGLW
jgi:hypothetical protein